MASDWPGRSRNIDFYPRDLGILLVALGVHDELKLLGREWRDVENDLIGVVTAHWGLAEIPIRRVEYVPGPPWAI